MSEASSILHFVMEDPEDLLRDCIARRLAEGGMEGEATAFTGEYYGGWRLCHAWSAHQ
jgi:hypothetical protein